MQYNLFWRFFGVPPGNFFLSIFHFFLKFDFGNCSHAWCVLIIDWGVIGVFSQCFICCVLCYTISIKTPKH